MMWLWIDWLTWNGPQGHEMAGPSVPSYPEPPQEGEPEELLVVYVELDEPAQVEAWRLGELERAGYKLDARQLLAPRFDIDLHRACELLASGCTQSQALAILL